MANVKFYIQGDNTSAMRAIAGVQGAVGKLGNTLNNSLKGTLAAAFGAGAIAATIKETVNYADSIDEASSRIDVHIEKLQEWLYAAKQSGASMEDLVSFNEKLQKFASTPTGAQALQDKGINPNQTPEDLFESVWKFANGKAPSEATPFLQEIGGKGGGKLFNMFQNDLAEVSQQAKDFGAVMSSEVTTKLAALSDQLSILSQILYSQVGPALIQFAGSLYKASVKTSGEIEKGATKVFAAKDEVSDNAKRNAAWLAYPALGPAIFLYRTLTGGMKDYRKKESDIDAKQAALGIKPQGSSLDQALKEIDDETAARLKAYDDAMLKTAENAKNRGSKKVSVQQPKSSGWQDVKYTPDQLKGNQNLTIGGLDGINTQYRIERLNKDQLDAMKQMLWQLKQINSNTGGAAETMFPDVE